ncbi:hypothetical protein [Streptomyces monomycini]|uniref:hypothetical protein n=1 Tax=Streptomyces monomycini TaxID=371720 RepID=UPI0012FF440B|nr:hypothetical protein [Streptomyces monomycini]
MDAKADQLRTSDGDLREVVGTRARTEARRVCNLSVAGIHTYYVLAGATPVLVHKSGCGNVALGQNAEGTYEWAEKLGHKHFGKAEYWQGPVEAAIRDTSNILHVNMKGVGSFVDAARDGLAPGHPYATDIEMGMIVRSVVHGGRSWDSIKFYRPGKDGSLIEFSVPEPNWGSFGRIRPYID